MLAGRLGVLRQKGFGPLVSSHERRALKVPRINWFTYDFVSSCLRRLGVPSGTGVAAGPFAELGGQEDAECVSRGSTNWLLSLLLLLLYCLSSWLLWSLLLLLLFLYHHDYYYYHYYYYYYHSVYYHLEGTKGCPCACIVYMCVYIYIYICICVHMCTLYICSKDWAVVRNHWLGSRFALDCLRVRTLTPADVRAPFLGTPLVPLIHIYIYMYIYIGILYYIYIYM